MDICIYYKVLLYIPGKAVTLLKFGTRLSLLAQPDNLLSCPKVLCHAALYNILPWSSFVFQVLIVLHILLHEQFMCNICNTS